MVLLLKVNRLDKLRTSLLALWQNRAVNWHINLLRLNVNAKWLLRLLLHRWLRLTMLIFSGFSKQVKLKRLMVNRLSKVSWLLKRYQCKDCNRLLMSFMALLWRPRLQLLLKGVNNG